MTEYLVIPVVIVLGAIGIIAGLGIAALAVEWIGVLYEALRPVSAVCGG